MNLTEQDLRAKVPSIYATQERPGLSAKYRFLPTATIVERLGQHDWVPTKAKEARVRIEARRGFQRHMIRFAPRGQIAQVGEVRPEIVLTNSHDGTSAYRLDAGLFRLVCSNGMVIDEGQLGSIRMRHLGFEPAQVVEASFEIIESFPQVLARIESFKATELTLDQRLRFAVAASRARWPHKAPIEATRLLDPRRDADRSTSLWSTLNVIQENLIRGGQRYDNRFDARRARQSVRAIGSIDADVRLNKYLWSAAEQLARGEQLALPA
jgi:hypothetical protein